MTVASNLARKPYTISGAGPYAIPFYFLADADIIAIQTPASGAAPITLTLTADYTLSGAGDTAGGALTLIKTGIDGDTLTIINEPDIVQLTQYPETGPFPAKSHETALDKLTMVAKRIYDMASRSLRLNDGDLASSLTLPAPSNGELLGWSGGVLVNTSPAGIGPGSVGTPELVDGAVTGVKISATYDGTLLHNTGDEAVDGIKTFTSSPIIPDAVDPTQAASKGQMDAADAATLNNAETFTTTRLATKTPNTGMPAAGSANSAPHSLGFIPNSARIELVCIVAERGFGVGTVVEATGEWSGSGTASPIEIWKTSTNVGFNFSAGETFFLRDATTGVAFIPTGTSWVYRFALN